MDLLEDFADKDSADDDVIGVPQFDAEFKEGVIKNILDIQDTYYDIGERTRKFFDKIMPLYRNNYLQMFVAYGGNNGQASFNARAEQRNRPVMLYKLYCCYNNTLFRAIFTVK